MSPGRHRHAANWVLSVWRAVIASALALGIGWVALAQGAPPPYGYWSTKDGAEKLLVEQSGTCKLWGARVAFLGDCRWNPSSRGGILTIMNVYNYRPAPIYFSVVWVNQNTITVDGDVFHRLN